MYYDLSLNPTNSIEITHLLRNLQPFHFATAALDYHFKDVNVGAVPESFLKIKQANKNVQIYSRATLIIQQNITLHQLNHTNHNGFDVMAIRPQNQRVFHNICVDYENYDIISLDMSSKLPFMLKRNPVYQALRKGKYFEIQYGAMFDDATRIICMTNIINLVKATGGKNLIISSHAQNFKCHRSPYDVAALMSTLGLNKNVALATMKENSENLLKSAIHRRFFKGTIKQMDVVVVKKLGKKIEKHRGAIKRIKEGAVKRMSEQVSMKQ